MCISATTALTLAMSGVGSYLQYKSQQDAIDRQNDIATREAMKQLDYQDTANREVLSHLEENYDPTKRRLAQEDIAKERTDYLQGVLAPDVPEGGDAFGNGYVGDVSDRYTAGRAQAVAGEMERAANLASLLGKTQAPSYLRQNEAISAGDLAVQLGLNAGDAASSSRVAGLKSASVRPNAGLSATGSALSGYASGMGNAAPTPTSTTTQAYFKQPGGMIVNLPMRKLT